MPATRHPALPTLPGRRDGVPWPTRTWPTGALEAPVDIARVEAALSRAFSQPEELGRTHSVVVIRGGELVVERHAEGFDETTTQISWSMAKSMLHAIVGVLVREERIDLDAPTGLPVWPKGDPRSAITLRQLLEMRPGLSFREDYVDGTASDVIEMLFGDGQAHVAAFASAFPLAHPPGAHYAYSSGTTNVASWVVSRILGGDAESRREFLRRELFGPLGMNSATPRFDAAGNWIASSFVFATAQDFARFGLLYLRDGVWEGRRLLPEGWVDWARSPISWDAADQIHYGAHWWVGNDELGCFHASGFNGQRILLVPALDLVVVRLGETPKPKAPALGAWLAELVAAFPPLAG